MNPKMHNSVLLAQQGNLNEFAQLVNLTKNLVTSTALAITLDVHASEDVAQQTYMDVWQQISNLKSPDSFLPWLRQITRNKAKNYLRDNKVSRVASLEEDALSPNGEREDPQRNPESGLAQQQIEQTLMSLVEALPPEHRDILILYYREQQNSAQVAQLMDLSEANVRQKLSRLRNGLKQELLQQLGDNLISTAPGVLFTAGVTSVIGSSLPTSALAASAVNSGLSNSSLSSFATKIIALLSGALLGGLAAISAILFASKMMQCKLSDEEQKRFVKNYTKGQVLWVAFSMVCFALSYEFTSGWVVPVAVYSIFMAGMVVQQMKLMKYMKRSCPGRDNRGQFYGWLGLLLGSGVGFAGMILGLINSGRMLF